MNFPDQQLAEFLTAAEHAAKLGGAKLMEMMGTAKVSEKAPKDLVTEADLASQQAIENYLLENSRTTFWSARKTPNAAAT